MILDTDILSAIVSPRCPPRVAKELEQARGPIYTTAVNWAEICYGLARHPGGARLRERYRKLVLPALMILDFDQSCAEAYGRLRADLEAAGERLGEADLLIAAIALHHRMPVVTGNTRHFRRVPGLKVVNWLAAAEN
jgi:tRNA(fMet)-specific endonuclease VapC